MEAAILVLNCLALLALVLSSLRNDARRPGQPLMGPFHYREEAPPPNSAGPAGPPTPAASKAPTAGWRQQAKADA